MPQLSLLGPVAAGPFLIPRIAVRDISVLWCCRTSSHNLIHSNLHKLILRPILSTQAVAAAEYIRNFVPGKETRMPDWSFFNDNDQALRMPAVETRDSLGTLAALIVANNNDLTNPDYDKLVIDLYETVKKLQHSYESCHISDG